jgi:hypothetical protein
MTRTRCETNVNLKQTAVVTSAAKPTVATGAIFSNSPGMPQVFKSNLDYRLVRAMCTGAYGDGGAVGEIYSTARLIAGRFSSKINFEISAI